VFARTGPSKGRDGITAFIVEKAFKALTTADSSNSLVLSYEINFVDCEVPEETALATRRRFQARETWLVHARFLMRRQ